MSERVKYKYYDLDNNYENHISGMIIDMFH